MKQKTINNFINQLIFREMKKIQFAFVILAGIALASCSHDLGYDEPTNALSGEAIDFSSGFRAVTRASYGADAAELLGNQFIVYGAKGAADGSGMSTVFDNYRVQWALNTAGTTASNTHDWEYVGIPFAAPATLTGNQTIKYWDYSTGMYRFAAYSVGKATLTTGTPAAGEVKVTAIDGNNLTTLAYALEGLEGDLAKCYISDMTPVKKEHYQEVVQLQFRSMAAKVRMAMYETVPGYAVKDVKFYSDNTTSIATGASSNSAILFSSDAFYTGGKYTVYFPDLASSNASIANLAHVSMDVTGATKANTRTFGELPSGYLGTTLNTASYAGSDYTVVLPNEEGANLQLRVDYTLESLDGSGETIKVHGARAYVPMIYTQWMPNYAYTYVFKISDNSNGRTSTDTSDPEGLFPITFDAVVESSVENTQSTITTVATPSITSYQMGHDPKNDDEYKAGKDIFIRLINDGALINDLNTAGKSKLYELGSDGTEVDVMAALNIGTVSGTTTTGRNGLVLNEATINNSITAIPRADGNDITVDAGTAASFSPVSGKTYAYVYLVSTGTPTDHWTAVKFATEPSDWSTAGLYALNPDGTGNPGAFDATKVYYNKYTNLNNVYAVKVIKIE